LKPSIEIIGVEAALYPSFRNAIKGEDQPIGGATLAEGIAVKTVGQLPLPIVRDLVSDIIAVEEPLIERAVNAYATLQRTMAEGAGAAGLAAMMAVPERFEGRRVGSCSAAAISMHASCVGDGAGAGARRAHHVIPHHVERQAGNPGARGEPSRQPGRQILEVSHGRLFLDVPAKGVSIDITVETRDGQHTSEVFEALAAEGLAPQRIASRSLPQTAF
jgi:threonine dehydratase